MMMCCGVVAMGSDMGSDLLGLPVAVPRVDWIGGSETPAGAVDGSVTLGDVLDPFFGEGAPSLRLRTKDGDDVATTVALGTAGEFLEKLVTDGFSAVFKIEELRDVSAFSFILGDVADEFVNRWTAHLYVSANGGAALRNHSDVTDIAVFQLLGHKEWLRCPGGDHLTSKDIVAKLPKCSTYSPSEMAVLQTEADCTTAVLNPGDVIFVPRKMVHSARALDGLSVHLTIGIPTRRFDDDERHLTTVFGDSCGYGAPENSATTCTSQDHGLSAAVRIFLSETNIPAGPVPGGNI